MNRSTLRWLVAASIGFAIAAPARAQLEVEGTGYFNSLALTTPRRSDDDSFLLLGLGARYRIAPWSFSGEYVFGGGAPTGFLQSSGLDLQRQWAELAAGYTVFDSLDLIVGVRHEDIAVESSQLFFFFPITSTVMDLEMLNFFAGARYQSDPERRIGLLASARVYRGSAEASIMSGSEGSEGIRVELGVPVRMGSGGRPWTLTPGVAWESYEVPDAGIELKSEPLVFLRFSTKI